MPFLVTVNCGLEKVIKTFRITVYCTSTVRCTLKLDFLQLNTAVLKWNRIYFFIELLLTIFHIITYYFIFWSSMLHMLSWYSVLVYKSPLKAQKYNIPRCHYLLNWFDVIIGQITHRLYISVCSILAIVSRMCSNVQVK